MLLQPVWTCYALAALSPLVEGRQKWTELLAEVDKSNDDNNTPTNFQYFPTTSNVTTLEPQYFPEHGSQRVKITYGPFDVQPMDEDNGMIDFIQVGAKMPCDNCTITYLQASLEYPNGTYANANTSLWLHHIVLIDHDQTDTVCGNNFYGQGQRWFASGNERTPGDISRSGTVPNGYYIGAGDLTIMVVELMNQAMVNQTAVPTIEYEYIHGFPDGFYKAVPIWMDIGGCTGSDEPPKTNDTFSYISPTYTVNFSGAIIAEGAHLHDGGTTLEIKKNDETECLCTAYYGQSAGYYDAPGTMYTMGTDADPFGEAEMDQMDHISSISGCYAPSSMLQPGDEITIKANYDLTEHMPMLNTDGSLADIMGISIIYAAQNMSEAAMVKYASAPAPVQLRPTLVDPAMEMGGNNDKGASGMNMVMTCSASDSPGNLSTVGLDMTDPDIQLDFLMAVLDDTCLQYRSSAYSRYFWYGIASVIATFALRRLFRITQLGVRKRAAAAKRHSRTPGALQAIFNTVRSITYRQYTPTRWPQLLKVPPVGTLLMIGAYYIFILCLVFVRSSTGDDQAYQSIAVRAAWVTVAQLPLVILLASKRNFIDLLTAVSYERLNVLHRWVARSLFLTATFHFGFQNEGWRRLGLMQLEWSVDTCPPTGVAAYSILIWMNISTLPPFRAASYEIFVIQHLITFFGLIIAIMLHIPSTALFARTYVYIAIGFYLFCRLIQTLLYFYRNIRPCTATLTQLSSTVVQARVHGSNLRSWTPGSFVLLGIPRFGLFQSHPATIASTPCSHGGDLIFILRARNGFTQKLLCGTDNDRERIALIDGPYGGKHGDLAAYPTAVLIAGSTGISFVLPILADMAERSTSKNLPIQTLHLVWAAKERNQLEALVIELNGSIGILRAHGVDIVIHLHVTNETNPTSRFVSPEKLPSESSSAARVNSIEKESTIAPSRPPGLQADSGSSTHSTDSASTQITHGRPNLNTILKAARKSTASRDEMGVAVCGPLSMSQDVRNVVADMKNVYLHVEGFSW